MKGLHQTPFAHISFFFYVCNFACFTLLILMEIVWPKGNLCQLILAEDISNYKVPVQYWDKHLPF